MRYGTLAGTGPSEAFPRNPLIVSRFGTREEDAEETPTQNRKSPSTIQSTKIRVEDSAGIAHTAQLCVMELSPKQVPPTQDIQGYLAHKKRRCSRNLQWDYAYYPVVALGGQAVP